MTENNTDWHAHESARIERARERMRELDRAVERGDSKRAEEIIRKARQERNDARKNGLPD